jgi:hypothetical protein
MFKFLSVLPTILLIVGCSSTDNTINSDSNLNESKSDSSNGSLYHGKESTNKKCNDLFFERVQVDNHIYFVGIPSVCNTKPEILKGDPGPDMGSLLPDDEFYIRKKILLRVNINK